MKTTPIKPEPLSIYTLHTPAEVRQHRIDTEDYFKAIRQIESAEKAKEQAAINYANRTLTEDDYFAIQVKRQKEQVSKQAELAAIQHAVELAAIDYKMSNPDIADIMESNEHRLLEAVMHWASRGYVLTDSSILNFGHGLFHVQLKAPAPTPTKKVGTK